LNKQFVADIKDRDPVETVLLVKEKITAMAKNGKPYLTVRLMDKSGEVDAKVWDNVDEIGAQFDKGDFIAVRGKASLYLGKMQLIIASLVRLAEDGVNLADFLPETERDIREMEAELQALLATFTNGHLQSLLRRFFDDPQLMGSYRVAPAAKGMHHVYLGGLLEHSLAVAKLVDAVVPLYGNLNRDLLVTGALLHDVGKVREMSYHRAFDYTDEGKLLGHITIGVEMVTERLATVPDFPAELAMLLKHMLLSHHGQYEYGSPKRPKTLEATILNYLDDLDSKINGIRTHIRKEPEGANRWTAYHRLYDRYYYLENGSEQPEESQAPPLSPAEAPAPPAVLRPADEPAAGQPAPPSARQESRAAFQNNPFAKLKDENLDLF
jgi:3'-5' exoribonuclease